MYIFRFYIFIQKNDIDYIFEIIYFEMSCNEKGCDNKALYGYKQKSVVYCKEHKKCDMVTVPLKYCEHGKQRSKCKECGGGSIC